MWFYDVVEFNFFSNSFGELNLKDHFINIYHPFSKLEYKMQFFLIYVLYFTFIICYSVLFNTYYLTRIIA